MALIQRGKTFTTNEQVTAAKLHQLVDSATISGIVNADVDSSAGIVASKLNLTSIAQAMTISQLMTMSGAAINHAKGSDIASATTCDIGAATGNYVHVTGTTTITGLGTIQAGTLRFVQFTGILTLTYNATSLILPTAANITTAAGDSAIFVSLGSGNWKCLHYQRYDGSAFVVPAGSVVQVANTQTGAVATGTTALPIDDTIPQITEGDQFMTQAITPSNANNKLKITVVFNGSNSSSSEMSVALFQDATANALAAVKSESGAGTNMQTLTLIHYMTAGTTSSTTFRVRAGGTAGTTTFNGQGGARLFGGVVASSITIEEIKV